MFGKPLNTIFLTFLFANQQSQDVTHFRQVDWFMASTLLGWDQCALSLLTLPRELFEEAYMNGRVSLSALADPILLDAVKYEFRKDGYTIVSLVAPIFQFHDSISNGTNSWPVDSLRSQDFPRSVAEMLVPNWIVSVTKTVFDGSHWLRVIDFPADSRICKLKGFQGYDVQCITIPASVELVHDTAFADCFCLEIVRLTSDSRLRQIDGFRGCSVVEVRTPKSVELIGRSGFLGYWSLRRVKFLHRRSLIIIAGFADI
jgi:hypothetical protein